MKTKSFGPIAIAKAPAQQFSLYSPIADTNSFQNWILWKYSTNAIQF